MDFVKSGKRWKYSALAAGLLVATAMPDGYALDIHLQGPHETVFFAV